MQQVNSKQTSEVPSWHLDEDIKKPGENLPAYFITMIYSVNSDEKREFSLHIQHRKHLFAVEEREGDVN